MQRNLGSIKFIGLLILFTVVAFFFYYLGERKLPKTLPLSVTSDAVVKKEDENLATYSNSNYGFSFNYSKTLSFKNEVYVAYQDHGQNFKAGSSVPVEIETVSDANGRLFEISVPVINLTLSVLKKPSGYKNLDSFVADEKDASEEAGSDSAAGVFVGDVNSVDVNGNKAISYSIQDGSAVGNTTSLYYFEKGDNIYVISYFYSRALLEGNTDSGSSGQKLSPDEVKKVDSAQKIISTFKLKN